MIQKKIHYQYTNTRGGFTVVELIVAMSLFIIVVSIATGIFIRALRTQRAIVDLLVVNDNATLVLEQITREVRLGTSFSTPSPTRLDFTNASGFPVSYNLNGITETLERSTGGGSFEPIT